MPPALVFCVNGNGSFCFFAPGIRLPKEVRAFHARAAAPPAPRAVLFCKKEAKT
jgi:hypothetical protein